jgi:hypothetical protein
MSEERIGLSIEVPTYDFDRRLCSVRGASKGRATPTRRNRRIQLTANTFATGDYWRHIVQRRNLRLRLHCDSNAYHITFEPQPLD